MAKPPVPVPELNREVRASSELCASRGMGQICSARTR